MSDAARYRYAPVLVIGALAVAALAAAFAGRHRSVPAGRPEKSWWLGADLALRDSSASPGLAGVRVKRVWNHSPARAAELDAGDIILGMNGAPVFTPGEVQALLSAPGTPREVDLVVLRGRQTSLVRATLRERPAFVLNIGATLLVLAAVFALLYLTSLDRVAVVGCGAVFSVILGLGLGFYDQQGAFTAIRLSTLALLLGMGLITVALEETGFFTVVATRIGKLAGGDWSRLMALLCLTTFFLSAFINNLSTILVILPLTLGLARELRFAPAPFVIAEVISSNLGGASSMIGDFPNMLIASEAGLHFHDFLLYMMPPCLVQLGITIWFMKRMKPSTSRDGPQPPPPPVPAPEAQAPALLAGKRKAALAVLASVVVAFFLCGSFGVPPATVALAGGFTVLLLWNRGGGRLIGKAGFGDILFFVGLFVLVGCAEASGLLDMVATWMLDVSGGDLLRLALVLMWAAAITTMFLNAGPTTALFVPIVLGLGGADSQGLFWWALSLGVCAGSSATITGATAGPVALTKVEEFLAGIKSGAGSRPVAELSFVNYAKVGLPLMFVFLLFSSAYVWGLTVWS